MRFIDFMSRLRQMRRLVSQMGFSPIPSGILARFLCRDDKLNRPGDYTDPLIESRSKWMPDAKTIASQSRAELNPPRDRPSNDCLQLHWILPDAANRSGGGHMSIMRHIRFLEDRKHLQTIWLRPPWFHRSTEDARATLNAYQSIGDRVRVHFLPDRLEHIVGDAVIATDWWTVYPALAFSRIRERFYLVQDFEPYFQPLGANYVLAEKTYEAGLKCLCAGPWLTNKLREQYGAWTHCWPLACDSNFYYPDASGAPLKSTPSRISFYYRPSTPRRLAELGLAAFDCLHKRGIEFHVDFFGEPVDVELPYSHTDHGSLLPQQLGSLYRAADIGLVFSATNYSLIPLEMMACGLPVVELDWPTTRAVFPPEAVFFVEPKPSVIAERIENILTGSEDLQSRKKAAASYIDGLDWKKSSALVEKGLLEGLKLV